MKLQEVTTYNLKSQTILNESWGMLTEAQRIHVGQWEKRVWPLMEQLNVLLEQELTPDQIQQIFTNAETIAVQGGNNKTALGKAGELTSKVTGKIKAEIEKLAAQAKNSGPIKNMDQQFKKLRADIALKMDSSPSGQKVLDAVDQWKKWSDENPGKSAFVIGAMTSILAFASGGFFSGAAIGFFLRTANNVVKGDDLSTALGKGVKGAAIGAIAGALGDVVSGMDFGEPEFEGGPAEVNATASSDEIASAGGEETAQALADMTEEQFREAYARELLERQAEKFNMPVTDAMIKKIADNIEITGNYPDDYDASFEGTFVRGTTYLTPDEAAEYDRIVQSNGGGIQGAFSKEANEFIKDAGGAGPNVVPDTPDDELDAAIGGDDKPETDSLAPGEGFTSESGASYSKEEMQNVIKQAAERGEIPDPEELVRGKDIDAGYYADDIQRIKDEFRELGIDNMKVPDEDALRAIGLDPEDVDIAEPRAGASDADLEKAMDQGNAKVDADVTNKQSSSDTIKTDKGTVTTKSISGNLSGLTTDEMRDHPKWQEFYDEPISDKRSLVQAAKREADMKFKRWVLQQADESLEERLHDEFALYEAGFADMIAKGKQKVSQVGKNIANKITADKLNSMWKKSGSPTDTGSIINILSTAGLSDSEIGAVGREANIKLTNVTNKSGEKDQAGSGDIQQRMEKLAADVKKHNLQKEVIAMLNAQGDVQQPTKQPAPNAQAGVQQGGYDTTVTQKQKATPKPQVASPSSPSTNPAYN